MSNELPISCYIGDFIDSYMARLGKIENMVAQLDGFPHRTETLALVSAANGLTTYQENLEVLRCERASETIAGYLPKIYKQLTSHQKEADWYLADLNNFLQDCGGDSLFPILCKRDNNEWLLKAGNEEEQKIIQKDSLGIELAQLDKKKEVSRYTLLYPFKEQGATHLLFLQLDSRLLGATMDSVERMYG